MNRLHPQALIYYALSAPIIVTEMLLLNSYLSSMDLVQSSFQALIPPFAIIATIVSYVAQLLPGLLIAVSLYGLITMRPALMVTMLTIFFLILTSILGTVDIYLSGLVVASSFLSLVGFSHARAAKLVQRRKLLLESHGPFIFKLASNGFDLLLPIISALGAMAVIGYTMGVIRSYVATIPGPLATLGTLYLESHFYQVMTTLTVAGAVVWVMRSLLEPVVLRFTLTPDDAREMAYEEVRDTYYKIVWESSKKPSRGLGSFFLYTTLLILAVTLLVFTMGPSQSINELLAPLGLTSVAPSHSELLTGNIADNIVRLSNHYFVFAQDVLKFIIRLLWG